VILLLEWCELFSCQLSLLSGLYVVKAFHTSHNCPTKEITTIMSQTLHGKLLREFKAIKQEAQEDDSVQLDGQGLTRWTISLFGAAATD
jgi:hypothetical protein